ncbi:MAG: fibronectin type III domain-containing protein, partial [Ruminococcus sp.]|nr:fibronectin type III domain-containing protein [Ruminococcus sp.]
LNGKVLTPSRDYTLTYVNTINAGTAFVIVNGIGSYNGSAIGSFTIAPKTVTSAVLSVNGKKYTYTGKALKPTTTVKLGNVLLKKDIDYTIAYSNNKNTGRATVRITGVGNYKGSRTVYFYIKPKALAIKKVTSPASKKLKVTWTKDTQATGYQIVVATNSAFTKNKKTVTITKNTTVAKTLTGLKAGKKYYVRLRAYKLVGKTKYYGAYGAKKSIKVK